jgi:N-acetylglucosaminyldiphosphoundecaprenol N-acetyl-beta-D-mannosaminyltransferase
LLVGMGNPLQERWIHDHEAALDVPVMMAVGGLFDHWAGNLRRAPAFVRRLGFEWLQLLLQQPHKFPRYALGNPMFLARTARWALAARRGAD